MNIYLVWEFGPWLVDEDAPYVIAAFSIEEMAIQYIKDLEQKEKDDGGSHSFDIEEIELR